MDTLKLLVASGVVLLNGVVAVGLRFWPGNVDKTDARLFLDYWWLLIGIIIIDTALVLWVGSDNN